MSAFEDIVREGNRSPGRVKSNWITCADGFRLSVIAGGGTYCRPRPALIDLGGIPDSLGMYDVSLDYPGPYDRVEVGYPSERPEPWHCSAWNDGWDRHRDHPVCDGWQIYASTSDDENDWGTVYAYVPVEMVRALIEAHGGEGAAETVHIDSGQVPF